MLEYIFKLSLWLLACVIVVTTLYAYNVYSYWRKRNVKYLQPYFPLGNLGFIMRKSFWQFCLELKSKHPQDYIGVYCGLKPVLIVQSLQLAKRILIQDFEYFQNRYLYATESDPLGSLNLFTVKNPMWKKLRHELTPMFTTHRLRNVTHLMNQNAAELVKKIQREFLNNETPISLKELLSMYTTDTVAYSVFGIRSSVLSGLHSPLWSITSYMTEWTFRRGLEFTLFLLLPAVATFLRLTYFSVKATKYIKDMFWSVVAERQLTRSARDVDLVNHLLKLKENLRLPTGSESGLADQIMLAQASVFILGSVESSATMLIYCLHELAYHPDVQEKLHDELRDALTASGEDILQYDDLVQLKYMTACIYETLRKYPLVSYIDRICNRAYKLDDALTVEPGVPVFINVVAIHYDEQYYPAPTQWRPDRFSNIGDQDNPHHSFLTFGDGPRSCIGSRFGMMQMRVALAQLITNYKLEPAAAYDMPLDPYSVIIAPKGGGNVKFVRR